MGFGGVGSVSVVGKGRSGRFFYSGPLPLVVGMWIAISPGCDPLLSG